MDGDDVRLHDLVDGLVVVLRQQQVLDGDETDERAVLGDVAEFLDDTAFNLFLLLSGSIFILHELT